MLCELVEEYGLNNWALLASKMERKGHPRVGKQCRERLYTISTELTF
jgi:hypothetical protein